MGTGIQARTSVTSIRQAQRRAEALSLRLEGLTLAEIGERMGVTEVAIQRLIDRALAAMTKAPTEELLARELALCDELLEQAMQTVRAHHPLVVNGRVITVPVIEEDGQPARDPTTGAALTTGLEDKAPKLAAIATAVRVLERRAKYLGIDAPTRTQAEVAVQPAGPDLSHMSVEELEAMRFRIYGGQPPIKAQVMEAIER